jgi:pilus assembly protein CpaB
VRFEAWPKTSVTTGLITKDVQPDVAKAVAGIVVRAPLVTGQPITEASIVRAGAAGFLAATIKPGMRAIGVPVNAETSAGGFILPNDRVDVVLTRDMSAGSGKKDFHSETILRDVRVLAVDQTAHQEKDQQTVVGKTATLELNPDQAVLLAQAQQMGVVSLALRALGDSSGEPVTAMENKRPPAIFAAPRRARDNTVTVFRYGVRRDSNASGGGAGSASGAGAAASNSNPDSGAVAPPPMAANTPQ